MSAMTVAMVGLTLALSGPALAQTNAAGDSAMVTLQLGESAERHVIQDRLRASLRVEIGAADARTVQGQVNAKMAAALERAKATPSVKAETNGYYVYEDRTMKRGQRWWGNQGLTLTSMDAAALLALAGQLQEDGLAMSGLAYELAPETRKRIETELIPEAIKRVQEKADTAGKALGLTHVRVSRIKLGESPQGRVMPLGVATAMAADRAQPIAPPVAEPGETTVTVQIEAEVQLRP